MFLAISNGLIDIRCLT